MNVKLISLVSQRNVCSPAATNRSEVKFREVKFLISRSKALIKHVQKEKKPGFY